MTLVDFICASVFMGLGVGVDVAAATFARANQLKALALVLLWVIGVSLTHSLFPMLGYLLTYFSVNALPALTPVIGIIAFACIALYLKSELTHFSPAAPTQPAQDKQLLVTCGVILAVSWDALWSGPAKSAQVVGWPESWVWLSFVIVGIVVALLAISSLLLARQLGKLFKPSKAAGLAANWLSAALQYTVIGYFGLLALCRYSLDLNWAWWQLLLLSALMVNFVIYLSHIKQLAQQRNKLKRHDVSRYRHWPSTIPVNR
ncbi:manganese efflux pump [Thalassomonas actiniarum]|uniref:Manganese efflux pump n=1 Tax=Thalassomonas actiniarum TaxID=485447 RepID=A0AAE9YT96_9GAMM|nr:manganese efflux pump [Thalassomonas actiniarum]WDD99092.1 manganese efflux pump [Thalassomonas actiniarum]